MKYFWTTDLASHERALAWLPAGLVPVLLPERDDRRKRWQAVLEWYAMPCVDAPTGPPPRVPALLDRQDFVVALGDEMRELATALAAALGRRCFAFDDLASFDPERFEAQRQPSSVWIFAAPQRLGCAQIDALGESLRCPWGLLTAPDRATASFVLAKLAASPAPRHRRWTNIDVLRRRLESTDHEGRPLPSAPLPELSEALPGVLHEQDHELLVISAHGESSHVSLQSVVLCALVDDCEADLQGRTIDGCRRIGDRHHCKRVAPGTRTLCAVSDLRAVELALMTCSGFSVAGDQYPSTSSLVHAAAQGYARSLLTTRDLLPVRAWVGRTIAGLARRGMSLGHIQALGNDLLARRQGRRPWVLFGDPAGDGAPIEELDPGRLVAASEQPRVFVSSRSLPPIISARPPLGELVRGHRHLVLVPEARQRPEPMQLVDAGAALERSFEQLARWQARLDRAASIERSLHCHAAAHAQAEGFDEALLASMRKRARLELLHQAGLTLCEEVRAHGVWTEKLGPLLAQLERAAAAWSEQLASMLIEFLLLRQFESSLLAGWRCEPWDPRSSCPRCEVALKGVRASDPLRALAPRLCASCPNCDAMQLGPEHGARLRVRLPEPLADGRACRIEVELDSPTPPRPGLLVAVLVDKGTGEPMFCAREWVSTTVHAFDFELPPRLSATLHTLELAWICDLDLSLVRLRSAGLPRPYARAHQE